MKPNPGQGIKIPHDMWRGPKKRKKEKELSSTAVFDLISSYLDFRRSANPPRIYIQNCVSICIFLGERSITCITFINKGLLIQKDSMNHQFSPSSLSFVTMKNRVGELYACDHTARLITDPSKLKCFLTLRPNINSFH